MYDEKVHDIGGKKGGNTSRVQIKCGTRVNIENGEVLLLNTKEF